MPGFASAATSLSVRWLQPLSVCQDCLASKREQPEPVAPYPLSQTVSFQPRAVPFATDSEVPPT